MFDAHIIRQDPWSCRGPVCQLFETLKKYGADQNIWGGIVPKMLLTKFNTTLSFPMAIRLPIGAERALRAFSTAWDEKAIAAWCDLMQDRGEIAEIYRDVLQHLVAVHGIECVAYWGSNQTIRDFCDEMGIWSVAMELGPTRPPFRETRYCDFAGVNGHSHTRLVDWREFEPMDLSRWRQSGGVRYADGAREDAMYRPLSTRHAAKIYRTDRPLALIAMQLDDDSNCLIHSKYSGMLQMAQEVVPRLVGAGWRVLVKPHPGASPERNSGGARWMNVEGHAKTRDFLAENFTQDEVVWLDDVPVSEYVSLLAKIDALVSVNSSMGFEAMLAGKVAVALGHAPYNVGDGLPTIDDLVRGNIKMSRYGDYAGRVCRLMLEHYLQPANLLSSPSVLSRAILRNMALAESYAKGGAVALTHAVKANPVSGLP